MSTAAALLSRRQAALGLLASGALLPLAGCGKPAEQILPAVMPSEGMLPGTAQHFATCLPLGGYGRGVLVTSWQGRPTKVAGNPRHPASLGGTDVLAEAAVLEVFEPDRSRAPRQGARPADWDSFAAALLARLDRAGDGAGLRVLTGQLSSPTLLRLLGAARTRYPAMRWYMHEPVGEAQARAGAMLAYGQPLRALPRLAEAAVVLVLDADPLGPGPQQAALARGFAARRALRQGGGPLSRWYAVEPLMTVTGAKADHRLAVAPTEVSAVARALAVAFGAALAPAELDPAAQRFVAAVAADLRAQPGAALVLCGEWQPPEVQALAHWLNAQLRAPVDHVAPEAAADGDLATLLQELREGDTLLILGSNPGYDAPAALDFPAAVRRAGFSAHMGGWRDETAALCQWHLPESHALEDWADLRALDGTAAIAQPLLRPLYGTRSAAWLLGLLGGQLDLSAHAAVRETWMRGRTEDWWQGALRAGVVPDSAAPRVVPPAARLPTLAAAPVPAGLTLALRPDAALYDGRAANSAWLQECPRPISSQVWGNAALLAPADAAAHGIATGDALRLVLAGRSVEVPALVQPGQVPGVVGLALGGGRRAAGAIGDGIGGNAYQLRQPEAPWYAGGLEIQRLGADGGLLLLQPQHRLAGQAQELLPSWTAADAAARPPEAALPSLLPPPPAADGPAWAMVIDTALCVGCNACVVACQAENNVPVVGPEEVARGRDMHWLRIDSYDIGRAEAPRPGFQPVPCMHCEAAPCEPVCPVAASVHDHEGLNLQVYNRCVGTRFCQANCPYKVRHFNFRDYTDSQAYGTQGADSVAAQRNPEVSVRGRGVMEKCTYCVQRLSAARRDASKAGHPVGEVTTACQDACPAGAIGFGDLRRTEGTVARLRGEAQHFALLGHLGTRPRTTYLADIRNPNPALGSDA